MKSPNLIYIQRCLELSKKGLGFVKSNPLVGAVIVDDNGKVIGEGYHQYYSGNHAEINAINSVKDKLKIPNSTLYINLEPCCIFGKTPPCVDTIIKNKIKKVVVSSLDPNPLVNGKGIEMLKNHNIQVELDNNFISLSKEINKRFFTFHLKKRPYVILKWAQTYDGFIDNKRIDNKNKPLKISNQYVDRVVHLWRSQEQCILIGYNTNLMDNPKLNVRYLDGDNPLKIIKERNSSVEDVLNNLYNDKIISVLVEGGKKTLEEFISHNLWDEIRIIKNQKSISEGIKAPEITLTPNHIEQIEDNIIEYYNY